MTLRPATLAATLGLLLLAAGPPVRAQDKGGLDLPAGTTALEGLPAVRIDTSRDRATRHELDSREAAGSRLTIRVADGRFYWSGRGDRPLAATDSGGFTYLSSSEPGRYVRIRQLNDRLTYVEHVDTDAGSVTYWGELRIVVGR
jgi:hypothetical protein